MRMGEYETKYVCNLEFDQNNTWKIEKNLMILGKLRLPTPKS